jgi:uncharacterized membrane protein
MSMTATAAVSAPPASGPRAERLRVRLRLDLPGLATAACFFCLSVTPSLLPRPWYLQGAISGVVTTTGYAVGIVIGWTVRHLVRRRPGWQVGPTARWILWYAAAALIVGALLQGARWQHDVYLLTGLHPPAGYAYLGVPLIAAAVFAPLLALARLVRASARALGRFLGRWIPPVAAQAAAVLGVAVLLLALAQGLVANGLMAATNAGFASINTQTLDGTTPPRVAEASGGPGSLVPWSSLGLWGRDFVASIPTVAQLSRFTGRPATQPVRVYVGLDSAPTVADRATLAVRELERTGGFRRQVLCVITTTGTGWVDQRSVVPLEYLYGGDTALVALQYSFLPSAVSFLADRDRVRTSGRELFDQVYDRWSRLAPAQRPKLLVFGESLGASGMEAAFADPADLDRRTDGALLIGPPHGNPLWGRFVAGRDPGTPEILPTYRHGAAVRFAGLPGDLTGPAQVIYLQHASDPVVWWSPRLVLHQPDWLAEPHGRDILPAMRWYPFVTFYQLTADMVFANRAPPGHGHNYRGEATDAWVRIVPPPGWTPDRTRALRTLLGTA